MDECTCDDATDMIHSAKDSIMKALECELGGHILEARMLYEDSIRKLHSVTMNETNQELREIYNKYLSSYENHVQRLRDQIAQHMFNRRLVERINIPEGTRGHSYEKLFACYFNETVSLAHIYEPQLTDKSQIENLIHFIEVLVKNCPNLVYVRLITRRNAPEDKTQMAALDDISKELNAGNVTFSYQFDSKLEEPRIIMGNGVLIKSSLGLHIYRPLKSYYKLGLCDFDFRRCLATTVDIYKTKPFAERITRAEKVEMMDSLAN